MAADGWGGLALDVRVPLTSGDLRIQLKTVSDAIAIVGPSGSGKSTILRLLAGVDERAEGSLRVDGQVWLDSAQGIRVPAWERRVGWVPQDALLFPHLSVQENLAFAGAPPSEILETAASLQLSDLLDRRPRRLSGGERQRVALGRALLASPRLLLLDEPFSALDRPLRAQLAALVADWAERRSIPLVLVSHDEEDARILAREQWYLSGGTLARS